MAKAGKEKIPKSQPDEVGGKSINQLIKPTKN
jgi:hypothetical protein